MERVACRGAERDAGRAEGTGGVSSGPSLGIVRCASACAAAAASFAFSSACKLSSVALTLGQVCLAMAAATAAVRVSYSKLSFGVERVSKRQVDALQGGVTGLYASGQWRQRMHVSDALP
jgi:hypothetical protein